MAATTYTVTAAGNKRIAHGGNVCHIGRNVLMEATAPTTKLLLAQGYITATVTGIALEGDAVHLTTYHVTAAGSSHLNHNQVTLTTGAALQLDAQDGTAADLLSRGYIS